jgi:hypothetical protein
MTDTTTQTPAPTPTGLTLQAGAFYRTANGSRVELLAHNNPAWPFTSTVGDFWSNGLGDAAHAFNGQSYSHRYGGKRNDMNIVAEWRDEPTTPGPVATVTTTRTEIRPGKYGQVNIEFSTQGHELRVYTSLFQPATAEELRAAATTLNDLAAGLDRIEAERNAAK